MIGVEMTRLINENQAIETFFKYAERDILNDALGKIKSNKAFSQESISNLLTISSQSLSASTCALLYLNQDFSLLKEVFQSGKYENCDFTNIIASSLFFKSLEPHNAIQFIRKIKNKEEQALRLKAVGMWQNLHRSLEAEPRVHLLLLSYNRIDFVYNALCELAKTNYKNYAVYIADNGSSDGTWEIVQKANEIFPEDIPVYVEQLPTNIGRPAGHNWLLTKYSHADAEYIAIGDDDLVSVPENWLEQMIKTFQEIPNCGCVGGKALSPGTPLRVHGGIRNFIEFEKGVLNLTNGDEQNDIGQFDYVDMVDHVIGCLHVFDKKAFEKAGLFDIALSPCQCVDIEHQLRLNFAGYKIAFNGLIGFEHWRAMGKAVVKSQRLIGNSIGNALKVTYKHDISKTHKALKKREKHRQEWLFS